MYASLNWNGVDEDCPVTFNLAYYSIVNVNVKLSECALESCRRVIIERFPNDWFAGDSQHQVHMEGYQVSNQCEALVRDGCLVPTKDAPELGFIRQSSAQMYVPDVFYKVRTNLTYFIPLGDAFLFSLSCRVEADLASATGFTKDHLSSFFLHFWTTGFLVSDLLLIFFPTWVRFKLVGNWLPFSELSCSFQNRFLRLRTFFSSFTFSIAIRKSLLEGFLAASAISLDAWFVSNQVQLGLDHFNIDQDAVGFLWRKKKII